MRSRDGEPRRAPIRWHVATVRDARAESPTARTLDILIDTIQPFPTFSEIYLAALMALRSEIATARRVEAVA